MKRRSRTMYPYVFLLVIAITNWFIQSYKGHTSSLIPTTGSVKSVATQNVVVKRVIDGDTIQINTGQKVRYIGIDTPEIHDPKKPKQCFGEEASKKNKELIEGKQIRMEKDVSETDRYGRLLRYVYVVNLASPSAELFVNEYLVKEGYAYAATFPPDVKYSKHFSELQNEAMREKKGLWSSCPLR